MSADSMSPLQVVTRIKDGEKVHLVDVRSPAEFNAVHAKGAILCPFDALNPRQLAQQLGLSSSSTAALLCAGGENRRVDRRGGVGVLADVTADVLSSERWRAQLWTFAQATRREGIVSNTSRSASHQPNSELCASRLVPLARTLAITPGEVASRGVKMHISHIQSSPT